MRPWGSAPWTDGETRANKPTSKDTARRLNDMGRGLSGGGGGAPVSKASPAADSMAVHGAPHPPMPRPLPILVASHSGGSPHDSTPHVTPPTFPRKKPRDPIPGRRGAARPGGGWLPHREEAGSRRLRTGVPRAPRGRPLRAQVPPPGGHGGVGLARAVHPAAPRVSPGGPAAEPFQMARGTARVPGARHGVHPGSHALP